MPHLLSIISDQAVPNLLFIRQFQQPDSEYFFVTTNEMEAKHVNHLIAALKIPENKCHRVLIDANDALLTFQLLQEANFPKDSEYLINITGGNKLMSQMVFQHFLNFNDRVKMLYAPIDSDQYQQLYPDVLRIAKDPDIKLSLKQYLYSYGFEITGDMPYYKGNPKPTSLFKKVVDAGGANKVSEINKAIAADYKEGDKNYLIGGWFEFYCYQFFKRVFRLGDGQIGCSVGLKKIGSITVNEHDNEFDLMFVFKNDLYVFECKVYSSPVYRKEKFQMPMYKLASLTQKFGLKCKKFLAVLADLPESPENLDQLDQLRSNLGIEKIIPLEDFKNYFDQEILRYLPSEKPDFNQKLELLKKKFKS